MERRSMWYAVVYLSLIEILSQLKENIPVQHRTVPSILNYILSLLPEKQACPTPAIRIQNVAFPPHHLDKPGDQPKCRGFALVVLASDQDKDFLLERWPWDRSRSQSDCEEDGHVPEVEEAVKFGFRTLSKARWSELKEEYLAYRQQLLDEINTHEDAEVSISVLLDPSLAPSSSSQDVKLDSGGRAHQEDMRSPSPPPIIHPSSPYPPNCLVFARNLHPETNKTTLRKLFSTALTPSMDGLDYVDYNKGMDSVRFFFGVFIRRNIYLSPWDSSVICVLRHQNMHRFLSATLETIDAHSLEVWTILERLPIPSWGQS